MRRDGAENPETHDRRCIRWLIALAVWLVALTLVRQAIASVSLLYFQGTVGDSVAYLTWATGNELTLAGVNVWRRDVAATPLPGATPGVKLNAYPVPPQNPGQPIGSTYWFTDTSAVNGTVYWYRLEWLDTQDPPSYLENENNPLVPGAQPLPTSTDTPLPTMTPIPTDAPILPTAPAEVTATQAATQPPDATNDTPAPPSASTPTLPPTATTVGPTALPGATHTVAPVASPPPTATHPPTAVIPAAGPVTARPTAPASTPAGSQQQDAPAAPLMMPTVAAPGLSLSPATSTTPERMAPPAVAKATATALVAAKLPLNQGQQGAASNPAESATRAESRRTGLILVALALVGLCGLCGLGYVFWRWSEPILPSPPTSAGLSAHPPAEPNIAAAEAHDWRRPGSSE